MKCRMEDLCEKDVVNIKDGSCLGSVDDVMIDTECAKVLSLIVFGRKKFFGLFGREPDIIISWEDIEMIGEDTVLIRTAQPMEFCKKRRKRKIFRNFFE